MSAPTEVELYFLKGKVERWIRFGAPISERTLDRRRRIATFAPGAFSPSCAGLRTTTGRWFPDRYSARLPRGEACSTVPWAKPARKFCCGLSAGQGPARPESNRLRRGAGLPPQEICPDHWRHVHSRLARIGAATLFARAPSRLAPSLEDHKP